MDTGRNGCFGKIDDHLVYTTPNYLPYKTDVLTKTFLQIILAAKWLVRHSTPSPKQQRRPLPSLMSDSSPIHVKYLVYGTYPGALTCGGVGLVSLSILLISGKHLWQAGRHSCGTTGKSTADGEVPGV